MYNIPTGSSDYPTPGTENGVNIDVKARPSPYMVSYAYQTLKLCNATAYFGVS